ncbi:replication initiation protein [Clostridium tarantellae]|uniref:RepB family plasmid replication initiator protein n=1 Tax=Clostridium tarantellae TaxID=39493 RepID=A0A6I1MKS8_9CLOT|nr:replication initiation protein [Clostridium tarantellae]MPQ43630.1 RepB family plasmid replication initiator protein [Clostridium tarantellae]
MNNEVLFKPNSIILASASEQLTASEYKLFDALLQRCQFIKDFKMRKAVLSREEIKTYIKDTRNNTIDGISLILERFMKIIIRFKINNKRIGATLISKYEYNPITDEFICSMHEEVYIALIEYNKIGYSPIDLKMVRRAKGYYTQRVYGMLRIWSKPNLKVIYTYTLEELKSICEIESGTSYDVYGNFKKKVLNPAIKEINEKLNMDVSFTENKVSRSVVSITFCIEDHEPRHYNFKKIDSDGDENKLLKEQISITDTPKEVATNVPVVDVEEIVSSATMKAIEELQINKIKISAKTLERNLNAYGEDIFNRAINILIGKKEEGEKIKAPVKFLTGILENLKTKDEIAATKAENENIKTLNFTNYSQREYDYDSLEKQLLGWDE